MAEYIVAQRKSVLTKLGMAHEGAKIKPEMLKGKDKEKIFQDLIDSKVIVKAPEEEKAEKAAPKKAAPKKAAAPKDSDD